MSTRKLIVSALAGALLFAVAGPRVAEASYGFIGQFTGGDCSTSGPNSYSLTCTKVNGQTVLGMAYQAPGAVAVTGGSVDGTAIGANQAAAVKATTLTANGALTNNAAIFKHITKVTTGATYTALATDNIIDVNKTTGSATAVTLTACSSSVDGMEVEIKDKKGDAATNNISVSPPSGTIDGQATVSLSTPYANGVFRCDGVAASWSLY